MRLPPETIQMLIDKNFNPRTHEGCDNESEKVAKARYDFNPRTHEGCDSEIA